MSGAARAQAILDRMDEIDAMESNLLRVSPAFRIRLIVADPDDDKFADCAGAFACRYARGVCRAASTHRGGTPPHFKWNGLRPCSRRLSGGARMAGGEASPLHSSAPTSPVIPLPTSVAGSADT